MHRDYRANHPGAPVQAAIQREAGIIPSAVAGAACEEAGRCLGPGAGAVSLFHRQHAADMVAGGEPPHPNRVCRITKVNDLNVHSAIHDVGIMARAAHVQGDASRRALADPLGSGRVRDVQDLQPHVQPLAQGQGIAPGHAQSIQPPERTWRRRGYLPARRAADLQGRSHRGRSSPPAGWRRGRNCRPQAALPGIAATI